MGQRTFGDGSDHWLILAALAAREGGVLNVSTAEIDTVKGRVFCSQDRIDGSGVDFFFWDTSKPFGGPDS